MRAAERCKYKLTAVRLTFVNLHSGNSLINFSYFRHIFKIKPRIHPLRKHIHTQCYNIHVTGSLSVSEKRSLYSVSAGKQTHFTVGDRTASVVMRMERDYNIFAA